MKLSSGLGSSPALNIVSMSPSLLLLVPMVVIRISLAASMHRANQGPIKARKHIERKYGHAGQDKGPGSAKIDRKGKDRLYNKAV